MVASRSQIRSELGRSGKAASGGLRCEGDGNALNGWRTSRVGRLKFSVARARRHRFCAYPSLTKPLGEMALTRKPLPVAGDPKKGHETSSVRSLDLENYLSPLHGHTPIQTFLWSQTHEPIPTKRNRARLGAEATVVEDQHSECRTFTNGCPSARAGVCSP